MADLLGGAGAAAVAAGGAGGEGGSGGGGEGGAGGEGGGDGGADPDWYTRLSTDADGEAASHRDWVKAKGFKDLDSVAKALRNAEKAIHDSGRVKIPGEGASAEEVIAWRKATGVPDDPKGYEIKAPVDADGNPLPMNEPMLDRLTAAAHKLGVPKPVLEALVGEIVQGEMDDVHAHDKSQQDAAAKWVKAQGADYPAKEAAINRAAGALGLSRDDMTGLRRAWGAEKALDVLSKLGAGMSEGGLLDAGGSSRFTQSGAEAQAELNSLKGDRAWTQKAMIPGTPENQRYKRLNDAIGAAADAAARAG